MTTKTKTIKFDDLMVQMKKYVAENDFRPVLKCVYFDGTHFIATNSHILLRVKVEAVSDIPSYIEVGSLYDPVKKEIVQKEFNYNYPETDRLIPNFYSVIHMANHFSKFEKVIRDTHKEIKDMDGQHLIEMEVFNAGFLLCGRSFDRISGESERTGNVIFPGHIPHLENDFKINLLSDFMKKANVTIKKLAAGSKEGVYMGVGGSMRPIHFYKEGVFDILVLPIRPY